MSDDKDNGQGVLFYTKSGHLHSVVIGVQEDKDLVVNLSYPKRLKPRILEAFPDIQPGCCHVCSVDEISKLMDIFD